MNKILEKQQICENIFKFRIYSPMIAKARRPGQFIVLQIHEFGERIPLTIADADIEEGNIIIIFQVVGKTTYLLSRLNEGDVIAHIAGPLGRPTHIDSFGTVVCVAGGIGAAVMYPIVTAMKDKGNEVIVIIGARSKQMLILVDEIGSIVDNLIICTDDGSEGIKGFVTSPLEEFCRSKKKPDLVVAIGPAVMMKACCEVTRIFGIKTIVSLNTIMVDATGMCGSCRVSVGGETKFVCVDGPEFDGHLVDFDNMIVRLNSYKEQEKEAYRRCRLNLD